MKSVNHKIHLYFLKNSKESRYQTYVKKNIKKNHKNYKTILSDYSVEKKQ